MGRGQRPKTITVGGGKEGRVGGRYDHDHDHRFNVILWRAKQLPKTQNIHFRSKRQFNLCACVRAI